MRSTAREIVQDFQKTMNLVAGKNLPPKKKERTTVPLVGEALRKSNMP